MHKYRARHIKEKRMFEVETINILECGSQWVVESWDENHKRCKLVDNAYLTFMEVGKEVILMQSTGLKDIEGNELREGDIMRGHAILDETKSVIDKVHWNLSGFVCNGCLSLSHRRMKKLGNIYENPELLNS